MKLRDLVERRARTEHPRHAKLNQFRHILFRNDAADQHADIPQPGLPQQLEHARHQRHVRPAQQAQAQPVGVLIGHGAHHRFGRLPQPRVDHMKARIAQPRATTLMPRSWPSRPTLARTIRVGVVMSIDDLSLPGGSSRALRFIPAEDVGQGVHDLADGGTGMGGLEQRPDQVLARGGRATNFGQTSPHFAGVAPAPARSQRGDLVALDLVVHVRVSIGFSSGSTKALTPTISLRFASTSRW